MFLGRKETIRKFGQRLRENPRLAWLLRISILLAAVVIFGIPFYRTAQSEFYTSNKNTKSEYQALQKSSHNELACSDCHVKPGLLNRLAGRTSIALGYYATKPLETDTFSQVPMEACLGCHDSKKLTTAKKLTIPHKIHNGVAIEKEDCKKCHKWVGHKEEEHKTHKRTGFVKTCSKYECHGDQEKQGDCKTCHHKQSTPEETWRKEHRVVATAEGANRCFEYCHTTAYCKDCHQTGAKPTSGPEVGTKTVAQAQVQGLIPDHARNDWLDKHGGYAQGDTEICLNCHAGLASCNSCHKKKRPKSHGKKDAWLGTHKNKAKVNKDGCLTCHSEKKCDRCHKLFRDVGR